MRMSITGRLNNRSSSKSVDEFSDGFTLIEISIVILLMGFLLSVSVPAIRENFLTDDLKSASRKLTATINYIKNRAVANYEEHILVINIDKGRYWYESEYMNEKEIEEARKKIVSLPDGIRIEDIHIKNYEKISTGEIVIKFNRKGYNRFTLIHIGSNKGKKFSFLIRPFLGKITLMEDYVDFEEIF